MSFYYTSGMPRPDIRPTALLQSLQLMSKLTSPPQIIPPHFTRWHLLGQAEKLPLFDSLEPPYLSNSTTSTTPPPPDQYRLFPNYGTTSMLTVNYMSNMSNLNVLTNESICVIVVMNQMSNLSRSAVLHYPISLFHRANYPDFMSAQKTINYGCNL